MFLTIQQGDEFNRVISDLTDERGRLEEKYFQIRSECVSAMNMLDDARVKAEEKESLLQELRHTKPDLLSDKLIVMSNTLQKLRLTSMKAERRCQELEERENYLSKLLGNRSQEVSDLEQQVAKLEKEMHIKEEKWRLQDNDRMRQYFNTKLGGDQQHEAQGVKALQSARPHTSAGAGFRTNAENSAHNNMLEDQISKLNQENNQLREELAFKDTQIRQLRTWQDTDNMVMGDDAGARDQFEHERVKFQAVHDQENKEMADAAYQTIKTLNEMLEQKKTQVRSKEEQIEKLRQQLADQREHAAAEQMKLQAEVTATGKSTLASLHRMVSAKSDRETVPSSDGNRKASELKAIYELESKKSSSELNDLRRTLQDTQHKLETARAEVQAEKRSKQSIVDDYESKVRKLESEVRKEQDKRTKLAKVRSEKNEKLLEKFQKQMVDYEAQILKLKDDNEVMRLKALSGGASVPGTVSKDGATITPTTAQEDTIAKLQAAEKKKDAEITKLKEAAVKQKKEQQEVAAKASSAENALADEKAKVVKYLREKEEALNSMRNAREVCERERYEKERYKSDLDKLLAEKRGTGAGAMTYSEMQAKLKELENDVYILQAQKKTVIAVNPRN